MSYIQAPTSPKRCTRHMLAWPHGSATVSECDAKLGTAPAAARGLTARNAGERGAASRAASGDEKRRRQEGGSFPPPPKTRDPRKERQVRRPM
ncbi:Hypothetical predicted protein [Pelobates cultripes]|uniref:Uncharacterized protein n=1 Tax=Pelobates cultripes TaxID=61616 RepID=A0AAD1T4G9_PELCU|nr:Hypothetical predicted protein [Pelobates cultripes]